MIERFAPSNGKAHNGRMRFRALSSMALVCLLALPAFGLQIEKSDYMGKTPDQVVKMGRSKWFDAYTKKFGDSTLGMAYAEYVFGDALKQVNDRKIAKLPKARRDAMLAYRKELLGFAADSHRIGELVSMGGTMWRNFDATIPADVEEILAEALSGRFDAKKSASVAAVERQFDVSGAKLKKGAEALDQMAMDEERSGRQVLKLFTELKTRFKQTKTMLMSEKNTAFRARMCGYLVRKLEITSEFTQDD